MRSMACFATAAFVLAACASETPAPGPTKAERDAAMGALFLCFEREYPHYDDGISPAPLIARAITQSGCQNEARVVGEIQTATVSRSFGQPVRDWIMDGGPLVDLVLRKRAERLNAKQR